MAEGACFETNSLVTLFLLPLRVGANFQGFMRNEAQGFPCLITRLNQNFTVNLTQNTVKTMIYISLVILRYIEKFSD